MGLATQVLEAVVREHAARPYKGRAVTLGRQTIQLTPEQTMLFLRTYGAEPTLKVEELGLDLTTTEYKTTGKTFVSDVGFFKALGFDDVKAADISDFEGAEILVNLNYPIDARHEGVADLLVDGSTLDNIYDPTTGLKNIARMVSPYGGRGVLVNAGNSSTQFTGIPYTMFNPMWFFDYFVWNKYRFCQIYTVVYDNFTTGAAYPHVYELDLDAAARVKGDGFVRAITSEAPIAIVVVFEKGTESTWEPMPTQHAYRNENDWAVFQRTLEGWPRDRAALIWGAEGKGQAHVPDGWKQVVVYGERLDPQA